MEKIGEYVSAGLRREYARKPWKDKTLLWPAIEQLSAAIESRCVVGLNPRGEGFDAAYAPFISPGCDLIVMATGRNVISAEIEHWQYGPLPDGTSSAAVWSVLRQYIDKGDYQRAVQLFASYQGAAGIKHLVTRSNQVRDDGDTPIIAALVDEARGGYLIRVTMVIPIPGASFLEQMGDAEAKIPKRAPAV